MSSQIEENNILKKEPRTLSFRNESFTVVYHYYFDNETGEGFTTTELDELNITQVHNQYRYRNGIPFIDEIKAIRNQYGLSASKMSELLGLGTNVYKSYENGEMPSPATGRLIQLIKDPAEFAKLLELASHKLEAQEVEKIQNKVRLQLGSYSKEEKESKKLLFGEANPNVFTGFKVPDIEKIGNMARYFSYKLSPFTTKMNKLLFYADFLHYKRTGYSISGLTYKALTFGPVPHNYGSLYDKLYEEGYIDKVMVSYGDQAEGEKIVFGTEDINYELFQEFELKILEGVVKHVGHLSTNAIIEASHVEDAWKQNIDEKRRINYQYSFSLKTIE